MALTTELVTSESPTWSATKPPRFIRMEMDDADARAIWFALHKYANDLEKSIRERPIDPSDNVEDKAFLFTELGHVYQLMFAIRDDHADPNVRRFIGI